ncbi:hypothetical protein HN51_021892 [Arachis hypogaea]
MPEEAIQLYTDVITILEEDGGGQMAFDLYRSATAVYIKLEKYLDAAPLQLKFGLAASKCNATNSQCKAYLSAIIIYLYTNDYKQAEMCYNDCSQIDAFCKSDQNRCASNLLAAYSDGDIEEIKRIAQSSSISNLDHSRLYKGSGQLEPPSLLPQVHIPAVDSNPPLRNKSGGGHRFHSTAVHGIRAITCSDRLISLSFALLASSTTHYYLPLPQFFILSKPSAPRTPSAVKRKSSFKQKSARIID